jgi:hypothetical protein
LNKRQEPGVGAGNSGGAEVSVRFPPSVSRVRRLPCARSPRTEATAVHQRVFGDPSNPLCDLCAILFPLQVILAGSQGVHKASSPTETDSACRTGAAIPTAGTSEDNRIVLCGTRAEQQRCGQDQNGQEKQCVGKSAYWPIGVRERKMAFRHN